MSSAVGRFSRTNRFPYESDDEIALPLLRNSTKGGTSVCARVLWSLSVCDRATLDSRWWLCVCVCGSFSVNYGSEFEVVEWPLRVAKSEVAAVERRTCKPAVVERKKSSTGRGNDW